MENNLTTGIFGCIGVIFGTVISGVFNWLQWKGSQESQRKREERDHFFLLNKIIQNNSREYGLAEQVAAVYSLLSLKDYYRTIQKVYKHEPFIESLNKNQDFTSQVMPAINEILDEINKKSNLNKNHGWEIYIFWFLPIIRFKRF